jgi:hypothetical protein
MVEVCPVSIVVGLAVMVSIIQGFAFTWLFTLPVAMGLVPVKLVPHQFSVAFTEPPLLYMSMLLFAIIRLYCMVDIPLLSL